VIPETVLGIPAHPLVIHAAVVLIPLLILGALVYAFVPVLRPRIGWAVALLAVVAPLSVLAAKLTGDYFKRRLIRRHLAPPDILTKVNQHQAYGTKTLYFAVALGLVTLALMLLLRNRASGSRPNAGVIATMVVTTALAIVTGYYIFKTGDTGAHVIWNGY
jgi:hypothetical protein